MGLIKSANAPTTIAPFSMKDIEEHARGMLLRARKQAEQLLMEAQQEGERLKEQARQEGYAAGVKAGFAEGNATGQTSGHQQALTEQGNQLMTLIQSLAAVAIEIDASRHQLEEEAGNAVVRLAVSIARKVTKLQGAQIPEVLNANVSEAARLVIRAADVRIALHPKQRHTLTEALPALKAKWPSLSHVELVDDETLAPGGCRIRTRGGLVDADLDGQVDRIAAELLPEASE